MNRTTVPEAYYMGLIAALGCLICRRREPTGLKVELHHVAEGSGHRSNFAVVPLCGDKLDGGHHRGVIGLHGLGTKAFVRMYRVPWEKEEGLLVWAAEDLANYLRSTHRKVA
jgi:hypothetical protein